MESTDMNEHVEELEIDSSEEGLELNEQDYSDYYPEPYYRDVIEDMLDSPYWYEFKGELQETLVGSTTDQGGFRVVHEITLGDIMISILLVILISVIAVNHLLSRIWR